MWGKDLYDRIDAIKQAGNDIVLLNVHLEVLSNLFKGPENDIILANSSDFVRMLDILKSIQESYNKCAKVLGAESAGMTTATQQTAINDKSITRRVVVFARIPGILAEIRCKAEQLQKMISILSMSFLYDVRKHQRDSCGKEALQSVATEKATLPENSLDSDLRTGLSSIDRMVENLMKECKHLEKQLQESTLFPDASAIQDYQAQNPEGASFWKDRFQKGQLYASTLRYETFYVSWARFVHEVESSFVLKMIPTGNFEIGDIDRSRLRGSTYSIDHSGMRRLSTIRPLWLPALRSALDPLHKGYVKPHDYFKLIQDCSLSDTLRRLVLESAGYGALIECERAAGDLALLELIESPSDHIGWTSAQIVAVPTPAELGIVTARNAIESSSDNIPAYLKKKRSEMFTSTFVTSKLVKSSTRVFPGKFVQSEAFLLVLHCPSIMSWLQAIMPGAAIFSSQNSRHVEANSSGIIIHINENSMSSATPKCDYTLLGPSKIFVQPPKVGEKVQIEFDGFWYDSKVTAVDGDEIEYVDWGSIPKKGETNTTRANHNGGVIEKDDDNLVFSEKEFAKFGKGTRRLWKLWRRDVKVYNVRPYRRFHIGDTIEAPVMYPDFRFHYNVINDSQLYLPARIIDVQGDQYVIEFSPAYSVHSWWPGRMPQGEEIYLVPGSDIKMENPFDFTRVTVAMDRVRPFIAGPRPALGVQSVKPSGWSSFQGIHLRELDDLLERSLWNNDRNDERAGG